MILQYTGPHHVRRVIDGYVWHIANGQRTQDVTSPALIADLLTGRESARWTVADSEPLRTLEPAPSLDQLIALAMADIAAMADLAHAPLSLALADALAVPMPTLESWSAQARASASPIPPSEEA